MARTKLENFEIVRGMDVDLNKVASRCCVCGMTLTDAVSLEKGIGPICRKKYRYEDAPEISHKVDEILSYMGMVLPLNVCDALVEPIREGRSRDAANRLVYIASAHQGTLAVLIAGVLRVMGYEELGTRIADRLIRVKVGRFKDLNGPRDNWYTLKTNYNPALVDILRREIPYADRLWLKKEKINVIHPKHREKIWSMLRRTLAGEMGMVKPEGRIFYLKPIQPAAANTDALAG